MCKSPCNQLGDFSLSCNLRQESAVPFQAKTSFTATASAKTSKSSKNSVSNNVFAEARDTLAPLIPENPLDSFQQNQHIMATISGPTSGNSREIGGLLSSVDYGLSSNKQVLSNSHSNQAKPPRRLSIESVLSS